MATQIKRRTGTTAEHSTFTGAASELTVNSTTNTVHVHDGTTAGGHPLAKSSEVALKAPIASPTFTGDLIAQNTLDGGVIQVKSNQNDALHSPSVPFGSFEVYSADISSGGAGARGAIRVYPSSTVGAWSGTSMGFDLYGGERMRLDGDYNLNLHDGNLVIGTSGKGIDFSAAGGSAAGSTSSVLDDYEEGTWTPAFSCSGGTWTPAGATAGRYVKIGNAVHISCTLIGGMSGARTGDVTITGFPFTCAAIPGYGQGMALAVSTNFQGENPRVIRVMANATYAKPYYYADLAGSPLITQGEDLSSVATYNILSFSGTYLI